jgi:hypothetical protein
MLANDRALQKVQEQQLSTKEIEPNLRIWHKLATGNRHCDRHASCVGDAQEPFRKIETRSAVAQCARVLVPVLGRNRAVNLAVDCCRFSDAKKGKLGTILARFWHNFGTNDFDILQLADFKYVCLWCREGGSNPHDRKGRRILSPPSASVSDVLSVR